MSLRLPPVGSPLRDMFAMSDVVAAGMPGGVRSLPTLPQSRESARRSFAAVRTPAIKAIQYLVVLADGNVALVQHTKRATRRLWIFGDPTK